jgi:hypothetical protein
MNSITFINFPPQHSSAKKKIPTKYASTVKLSVPVVTLFHPFSLAEMAVIEKGNTAGAYYPHTEKALIGDPPEA